MMQTALVTGGAGFIGSHLVARLAQEGWRVRVLDNLSTGSLQNLAEVCQHLEVITGDIRDENACRQACRGVDSVFHLAAIASVASSVADPATSHDVNITGTLRLLLAARDAGVRRFVFSSSASVYGNTEAVPTSENEAICPESPYASGKACGELYCRNFQDLYGLETVVLRYFNVFGPRQNINSGYAAAIPAFVHAAVSGSSPIIYGDGLQTRDFVHVANVVEANFRAALAPDAAGRIFNVASGYGISLLDVLAELEHICETQLHPNFQPARAGEVRHSRADISRARSVLGYEPTVSLQAGLKSVVDAALAQRAGVAGLPAEH